MTLRYGRKKLLAVLAATVGLGAGAVAYFIIFPGVPSHAGPDELRYIPYDAATVAYVDVRALTASKLTRRLQQAWFGSEDAQEAFQRWTGINVEADVDHLVAGLKAAASPSEGAAAFLVVARGRFDEAKVELLLTGDGARVERHKDKRLLVTTFGADSMALSFVKPDVVVAGHAALVRQSLDLDSSGDAVTTNSEAMNLVRSVDSGTVWAVGRFDALYRSAGQVPVQAGQLQGITWVSFVGHVTDGVTALVRAETRDEASANSLRELLRGFVAIAKVQSGGVPRYQQLLQTLELGGTGTTVSLSFSGPLDLFDSTPGAGADRIVQPAK